MASTPSNLDSAQAGLKALKGEIPLIGLTGGIGSGKTAVSDLLGELGAGIIDTDLISHQITAPGGEAIPMIAKAFGDDFIDSQGALIRSKMRTLVFQNPTAKKELQAPSPFHRREGPVLLVLVSPSSSSTHTLTL